MVTNQKRIRSFFNSHHFYSFYLIVPWPSLYIHLILLLLILPFSFFFFIIILFFSFLRMAALKVYIYAHTCLTSGWLAWSFIDTFWMHGVLVKFLSSLPPLTLLFYFFPLGATIQKTIHVLNEHFELRAHNYCAFNCKCIML